MTLRTTAALLLTLALALAACTPATPTPAPAEPTTGGSTETEPTAAPAGDVIELSFWSPAAADPYKSAYDAAVQTFNAEHPQHPRGPSRDRERAVL